MEVITWTIGSNLSTSSAWTSTGADMDKAITGDLTIGGRGSNRSFQGKVASMVVTTLRINQPMPTDAEIDLMITDPTKWVDDYKVGELFRPITSAGDLSTLLLVLKVVIVLLKCGLWEMVLMTLTLTVLEIKLDLMTKTLLSCSLIVWYLMILKL